jgi:hypothetical protein
VPRLGDASWSFLILFSQDGVFMALALALRVEIAVVCAGATPAYASL